MILTFIRSSALTTYQTCPGRFFIEYNIGRRGGINEAALIGSTVHAVMESAALMKLALQNNEGGFEHSEFGNWDYNSYSPLIFLDFIYDKYNKDNPGVFTKNSFQDCRELVDKAFIFNGGVFNPFNQNVVSVEYPFEIEIKSKWAHYSYDTPEGKLEGYLTLKGTCDLTIKENQHTLHYIDYKTGKSLQDWGTGKDKNEYTLYDDPQLKLYYYALSKCFPEFYNILMTLYYIRLDQPFTIIFDKKKDLPRIEKWIKEEYLAMLADDNIEFIINSDRRYLKNQWGRKTDRCKYCVHYNTIEEGTDKSVCAYFRNKLNRDGYERVMAEEADFSTINEYGSGGSVKERV